MLNGVLNMEVEHFNARSEGKDNFVIPDCVITVIMRNGGCQRYEALAQTSTEPQTALLR